MRQPYCWPRHLVLLAALHVLALGAKVEHRVGFEAAGELRHVAGSACCHPAAEPQQVASARACERRCVAYEPCDAFVFAPGEQLCFLVRFSQRSPSIAKEERARPAADRVFGLVRGGGVAEAAGGGTARQQSESRPREKAKKKKKRQRGKGSHGNLHFDWADVEVLFGDCEDSEFCGAGGPHMEWEQDASFKGRGRSFGGSAGAGGGDEGRSSDDFEQCFVFLEEDVGACGTCEEQWERTFKQRLWPDAEACVSECSKECREDLQTTREKSIQYLKELVAGWFGNEVEDADIFEFGLGEDDEQYCAATCGEVCDDLDLHAGPPRQSAHDDRAWQCPDSSAGNASSLADHLVGALQAAFDRAGARLAQWELAPPLPLLGDAFAGQPGLSLGADVFTLDPLFHGQDLGATGLGGFDLSGLEWDPAGDGEYEGDWLGPGDDVDEIGALLEGPLALGAALPSAERVSRGGGGGSPVHPMGLSGSSWPGLELQPLRQSLFQGLPEAARWGGGAPGFLEAFREKTMRRLRLLVGGMASGQ